MPAIAGLLALVVTACGGGGPKHPHFDSSTSTASVTGGVSSTTPKAAQKLGFPTIATKNTTRVPGAKSWIKGLANVRGQLLPIIDLRHFLGSGITPITRNTRVLVVNHREIPAGLVVDEVLGFRRFAEGEFSGDAPPTVAAGP